MKGKRISRWLLFAMSGMIMAGTMLPAGAEELEQVMEKTIVEESYEDVLLPEEEIVRQEEASVESENQTESTEVPEIQIADEIVVESIELYSANEVENNEENVEIGVESYDEFTENEDKENSAVKIEINLSGQKELTFTMNQYENVAWRSSDASIAQCGNPSKEILDDGSYVYSCPVTGVASGNCIIEAYDVSDGTIYANFEVTISEYNLTGCVGTYIEFQITSPVYQGFNFTCEDEDALTNPQLLSYSSVTINNYSRYTYNYKIYANKVFAGKLICTGMSNNAEVTAMVKVSEHQWDSEPIEVEDSNCTEAGEKIFSCIKCATTKTEEIPAKGHTWNEDYTVDTLSTCKEKGSESIHCSICNVSQEGTSMDLPLSEHSWNDEYTIDKYPTYVEVGSKSIHCRVCGEIKENSSIDIPVIIHEQYGKIIAYGSCGAEEDNLKWAIGDTNEDAQGDVLVISGKGQMADYSYNSMPWYIYNSYIRNIYIEEGITSIGENAFYQCENLTKITLPESINRIGSYAFAYSKSLSTVNIPNGVKEIEKYTFIGCEKLSQVNFSDSLNSISAWAFAYCNSLEKIEIPSSVITIKNNAFYECTEIKEVSLPESLEQIGVGAFQYCNSLSSIIIPTSVKVLETQTFWGCTNLQRVELKEGIEYILDSAFVDCDSLESIRIPYSMKEIYGFDDSLKIIIGYDNSYAKEFANKHGKEFVSLGCYEHSWNVQFTVDKEATCTESGSQSIHCSVCDAVQAGSTESISVKGHSWDAGNIVVEANCTETGEMTYKCTECLLTKTVKIPTKGHVWNTAYAIDKAPTCTDDGSKSYHCSVCDAKMEGSDVTINAAGHTWGTWNQTVAPTVKAEGTEERECSVCHETEERSIAKLPLNLTKVKLNKLEVVSGDHLKVSWKKVDGADGYLVYRRNNGKWQQIAKVKGNNLTYTDKTTKIGTKYTYTVKAYTDLEDETVYGGYNKTGVTLTQTYYKSSVKLTSAKATSTKAIQIKWKTRSKADGYIIFRKTPGSKWKKIATVGKKSSYTDKKCKSATTYLYTVKAYTKVNGKTIYSNYDNSGIVATTKMLKPTIKVSSKTKKKATISWSKQSNVSGYAIYRKKAGGKWSKIKTLNSKKSSYVDKNLKSGKTYYYAVKAYIKANPIIGIDEPIYSAYYTKKVKIK